jgi:hypothetical protein
MAQHAARHYPATGELPRSVLVGAAAGAVSVLVFRQAALALLQMFGFSDLALVWPLVAWGGGLERAARRHGYRAARHSRQRRFSTARGGWAPASAWRCSAARARQPDAFCRRGSRTTNSLP